MPIIIQIHYTHKKYFLKYSDSEIQCSNLGQLIFTISSARPLTFFSLAVGKIINPFYPVIFLKNLNTEELIIQS